MSLRECCCPCEDVVAVVAGNPVPPVIVADNVLSLVVVAVVVGP